MEKTKQKNYKEKLHNVAVFFAIAIPSVILWIALICGVKYFLNPPVLLKNETSETQVVDNRVDSGLHTTDDRTESEDNSTAITTYNTDDSPVPITHKDGNFTTMPVVDDVATLITTQKETSDSTTKPKKIEKTTKSNTNNNSAYEAEIEKENQKHQDELIKINSEYKTKISYLREDIVYYRQTCGYTSSSSYLSSMSVLEDEVLQKEKKLAMMKMDTSGVYRNQILALERELENDYAELEDLNIKYYAALEVESREAELQALERENNYAINYENERHEEAIEKIKSKYGK